MIVTPPPCLCGEPTYDLPDDLSHCMVHHVNERIAPEVYRVCGECGHVYPSAQHLVDAENVMRRTWFPKESAITIDGADSVIICPLCIHDF